MSSSRPGDDGDHLDDFDRIVAGLELSLPADLQDVRAPVPVEPQPDVFEPRLSDPLSADDLDDSDHFVPPEPEPMPELDPPTRAAWGVLIGAPLVLLVMTVFNLRWPTWLPGGLVLGFIGAMMFLLARRGNHDRGNDPDQGAVI